MVHYETLILSVPEITASEAATIEEQLEKIVKKNAGKINTFDRWGKYRLAYPVRENDYGVYFLVRFEADQKEVNTLMKEIDDLFKLKLPQVIMRYMNTKLDSKKPLTYQKPESLEDIPSQDVDTFLRENKMEGLLKKSASSSASAENPAKQAVVSANDEEEQESNDEGMA